MPIAVWSSTRWVEIRVEMVTPIVSSSKTVVTGGGTAARRAAKAAAQSRTRPKSRVEPSPASDEQPSDEQSPAERSIRRQLDPDALAVLEEQRAFLLASLRDLEAEHEAGDVDEVDYGALKDDYTARAAGVIRAIEDRQTTSADIAARRRRSPLKVAGMAAAVLAVALLAGVLMAQASGRRNAGDTITGDIRQDSRNLLAQAQSQFGQGQYLDAIKTYDQVLAIQPANTEALTYKGWLLYRVATGSSSGQSNSPTSGQSTNQADLDALRDRALQSLDDAVRADASYPDAHIFRAIIDRDLGRNVDAAAELARVKPDQVPQLMRSTVDDLRTQVGAAPPATAAP
jgi:tetratricopeptide (TPR) repeat protein